MNEMKNLMPLHELLQLMVLFASISLAMCYAAFKLLSKHAVLDKPESRSNHKIPTPVGGGIGFAVVIAFSFWAGESFVAEPKVMGAAMVVATLLLAVVSLADDVMKLPVRVRIFAQIVAMTLVLKSVDMEVLQLKYLPFYASIALCLIGWFWFVNLFNFMDGIDGIAATEAISISAGLAICGYLSSQYEIMIAGSFVFAAVLPFLLFNWSPARIFMGDSGSITLGFVLGFALLMFAVSGQFAAAVILPAYFVSDATYTIVMRIKRKEKIWQAHSSHAYQKAVRKGARHAKVTCMIALLNIVLLGLAVLSVKLSNMVVPAVIAAYLLSAFLMKKFSSRAETV